MEGDNDKVNGVNSQVLGSVLDSTMKQPEMAKATFSVKTEWNGGFRVKSTSRDFRLGNQKIQRKNGFMLMHDFPDQFAGGGEGPTVCESCMASLGACIAQTIIAHSTMRGIALDGIRIEMEGDVDLRGFTGLSDKVRPGAQQFRVNVHIDSKTASKEQINQLYEIGKRLSPAVDTLTKGTSIVIKNTSVEAAAARA
jgi:uncharacterized OsmC-like protein